MCSSDLYFVTQNPLDVPETVLGQLGNRVQHALRAFTPKDAKAVKTAASTMRANPAFDTEKAIQELAVGEALVSFLDEKGSPTVVERCWIYPPAGRIGPLTPEERKAIIDKSPVKDTYEKVVDRESAYEKIKARAAAKNDEAAAAGSNAPAGNAPLGTSGPAAKPVPSGLNDILFGTTGPRGGHHDGLIDVAAKSATRAISSGIGRQIVRGVLGSIFGGKR